MLSKSAAEEGELWLETCCGLAARTLGFVEMLLQGQCRQCHMLGFGTWSLSRFCVALKMQEACPCWLMLFMISAEAMRVSLNAAEV